MPTTLKSWKIRGIVPPRPENRRVQSNHMTHRHSSQSLQGVPPKHLGREMRSRIQERRSANARAQASKKSQVWRSCTHRRVQIEFLDGLVRCWSTPLLQEHAHLHRMIRVCRVLALKWITGLIEDGWASVKVALRSIMNKLSLE